MDKNFFFFQSYYIVIDDDSYLFVVNYSMQHFPFVSGLRN